MLEFAKLMLELYGATKSKIKFVSQEEVYGNSYEDIPRRVPDNTKMRTLLGVEPRSRCARARGSRWNGSARKPSAEDRLVQSQSDCDSMEVALKIDVDTHQGLGEGVPRLLRC